VPGPGGDSPQASMWQAPCVPCAELQAEVCHMAAWAALPCGDPLDDVGKALAWPAQVFQFVDDRVLEPDEALAVIVRLVLEADRAEQQRGGEGVEGGGGDGDADHARFLAAARSLCFFAAAIALALWAA
jgi:hypothetical protein